jgi:hypothetical protein
MFKFKEDNRVRIINNNPWNDGKIYEGKNKFINLTATVIEGYVWNNTIIYILKADNDIYNDIEGVTEYIFQESELEFANATKRIK